MKVDPLQFDDIRIHDHQMSARQGNHDGYRLPDCLAHMHAHSPPLYLAVAHWMQQQGRPIGRNEVSEAFHISPRRAAEVMRYIYNHKSSHIVSSRFIVRTDQVPRVLCMTITSINLPTGKQNTVLSEPEEIPTVGGASISRRAALWQWLLSRPCVGEGYSEWQEATEAVSQEDDNGGLI
ncbi:CaiF/GrlA family transcriptional regulator [Yersinia enterocolitica]|nr:CaiF/GrlA family transcriptional regulator [Yersinia enterocolitica]EKN5104032.1 CaiF/GrlA family transcriptional regulator [Yersinia enterocolitica]